MLYSYCILFYFVSKSKTTFCEKGLLQSKRETYRLKMYLQPWLWVQRRQRRKNLFGQRDTEDTISMPELAHILVDVFVFAHLVVL